MSERRDGWYWIKLGDCSWEAAHWTGDGWEIVGINEPLWGYKDLAIGPRIPTPDEPWVCVPKEPTEAMLIAEPKRCHVAYQEHMEDIYSAMLSAGPKPEDV